MVLRQGRLIILSVVATAICGCRAGGVGNLSRTPEPIGTRPTLDTDALITRINNNARQLQSLKAEPSITVISDNQKGAVSGRLAFQRPQNFKLELNSHVGGKEADIGSNEKGFWFWVRRTKDRNVYVCSYDESGESPLEGALQPDWIVEALGLRGIPEGEVADIQVDRTSYASKGWVVLTRRQRSRTGGTFTKVMYVEAASGHIVEHRLYNGDPKKETLLARAVIQADQTGHPSYKRMEVPPASDGDAPGWVELPNKIYIEWIQERLALQVDLGRPHVNVAIDDTLFAQPEFRGYTQVDLSKDAGLAGGPTQIRETRPAPPANVRLNKPEPLGGSERPATSTDENWPLSDNQSRTGADRVIGARWPSPPEAEHLSRERMIWVETHQERGYEP